MGTKQIEQVFEIMRFRKADAEFLKQRLEVFLDGLLAMEADNVPQRRLPYGEFAGCLDVFLGLAPTAAFAAS